MKQAFLLVLVIISTQVYSQTFTTYTEVDGLINNSANCVAVDGNDNIWFGTQEGLSYFDGFEWENYDQNSVPELLDNTIKAVFVDSKATLWVGTDFGVNRFDGITWSAFEEAEGGLADNRIKYIAEDNMGRVWFAHSDGVSILDGEEWTSLTSEDGVPFGGVGYISFDSNNTAYMASPLFGLLRYADNTITVMTTADGLLSDKVRTVSVDKNDHKWVGTSDGLSQFDENDNLVQHHLLIFELPPPHELNPIEDVKIDCEGTVWVGIWIDYLLTEGGLSIYQNGSWEDYNDSEGIAGPVVRKLDIDSEGVVWIATSSGITKVESDTECMSNTSENLMEDGIHVYPNPVSELLTIVKPTNEPTPFRIINQLGQIIQSGVLLNANEEFNTQLWNPGPYHLILKGTTSFTLIKE